jgi:hypothetical protein
MSWALSTNAAERCFNSSPGPGSKELGVFNGVKESTGWSGLAIVGAGGEGFSSLITGRAVAVDSGEIKSGVSDSVGLQDTRSSIIEMEKIKKRMVPPGQSSYRVDAFSVAIVPR